MYKFTIFQCHPKGRKKCIQLAGDGVLSGINHVASFNSMCAPVTKRPCTLLDQHNFVYYPVPLTTILFVCRRNFKAGIRIVIWRVGMGVGWDPPLYDWSIAAFNIVELVWLQIGQIYTEAMWNKYRYMKYKIITVGYKETLKHVLM